MVLIFLHEVDDVISTHPGKCESNDLILVTCRCLHGWRAPKCQAPAVRPNFRRHALVHVTSKLVKRYNPCSPTRVGHSKLGQGVMWHDVATTEVDEVRMLGVVLPRHPNVRKRNDTLAGWHWQHMLNAQNTCTPYHLPITERKRQKTSKHQTENGRGEPLGVG